MGSPELAQNVISIRNSARSELGTGRRSAREARPVVEDEWRREEDAIGVDWLVLSFFYGQRMAKEFSLSLSLHSYLPVTNVCVQYILLNTLVLLELGYRLLSTLATGKYS